MPFLCEAMRLPIKLLTFCLAFIGCHSYTDLYADDGYFGNILQTHLAVSDSIEWPKNDTTPFTVRAIIIRGNKRTRLPIINRELALQANQSLTKNQFDKRLLLSKEQLMNTQLFVKVQISPIFWPGNLVDVEVEVFERWYLFPLPYFAIVDRNLNVWIKEHNAALDRTNYGLRVTQRNVTGRNDEFFGMAIAGYTQQLAINYALPYADRKLEKGFKVGMSYSRKRELNYLNQFNKQEFQTLDRFGQTSFKAEFAFSYRKGSKIRSSLRSYFGIEKIDTAFEHLNPSYFGSGNKARYVDLVANFRYLNVDYLFYPLTGWMVDGTVLKRFSNTIPMTRFNGSALFSQKLAKNTYGNMQLAAVAYTRQPKAFFNQRMMGYDQLWMQGLENYVVEGYLGVISRQTIRTRIANFSFDGPQRLKAYRSIPLKIYGKVFFNEGYVATNQPKNSYLSNRLLRTWGVGVDFVSIYDLVIKMEYSFNQFKESGFFLHTTYDF